VNHRRELWPVVGAVVAGGACLAYGAASTGFGATGLDTLSYLFQGRLFAQGHLTAPAPPSLGFSPSPHINVVNGLWYSKYSPGNALALALGVKLGAVWLVPTLATACAVWLLYHVVRSAYGQQPARIAVVLAVLSPPTYVMGSQLLSEAVSRLVIGAFLYTAWKGAKSGRLAWWAASGVLLGLAFDTRPLSAIAIGSVALLLLIARQFRQVGAAATFRTLCVIGAFGLIGTMPTLLWNYQTTGDALTNTFNVQQPYDRLGFGPRSIGFRPSFLQPHSAVIAVRRMVLRTAPAIVQSSLGIGFYRAGIYDRLFRGSIGQRAVLLARMLPYLVPLGLLFLALRQWRTSDDTLLFAAVALATPVAYSLYWFDGASFGYTPVNTRYHTESIMFGMLPLMAAGTAMVRLPSRRWLGVSSRAWLMPVGLIVAINYATNARDTHGSLVGRNSTLRAQDRAVRSVTQRSVVFFRTVAMPLGDYPLVPLEQARVVTFRLNCDDEWGLYEDNMREVYRKYFKDRQALIWESGRLIAVEPDGLAEPPNACPQPH
jgi:hypothetical protein